MNPSVQERVRRIMIHRTINSTKDNLVTRVRNSFLPSRSSLRATPGDPAAATSRTPSWPSLLPSPAAVAAPTRWWAGEARPGGLSWEEVGDRFGGVGPRGYPMTDA
jgi:hypothetical protein